jgi:uroporphyrinogen-III synthase
LKKKILLARPRASSERWAALLARHGFDCVIEPLLTITPTRAPRPAGLYQAVMITSFNALDALSDLKETVIDLLALPCFCVGSTTGEAARNFGFTDIRAGNSDGAGLAQEIVAAITDKTRPILHIAGDIIDGKAQDILARNHIALTIWPVYQATAAEDFTPATRALFANGQIRAIPVFSPRSARVLVSIIEKEKLTQACHRMAAIALSPAVADMLQTLPWRQLRVAANPAEEDVIACLQTEFAAPEPDPASAAPPTPFIPLPPRAKKRPALWGVLGIILLTAVGSAAWLQYPLIQAFPVRQPTAPESDLALLQQRVQILEARLDTQNEVTAAAPQAPTAAADTAEITALTESVKNLQSQLAQMRGETQKTIAAALAFWNLREAAKSDHGFAAALDTLRSVTISDVTISDVTISEQAARLDPYAATGMPTWPQLRESLAAEEASIDDTAGDAETATGWWTRIKSVLRHLVSVHPAHNLAFTPIESDLDSGDGPAALEAFKALPFDAQQHLAAWHEKLQGRTTIDDALQKLSAAFTASGSQDSTP